MKVNTKAIEIAAYTGGVAAGIAAVATGLATKGIAQIVAPALLGVAAVSSIAVGAKMTHTINKNDSREIVHIEVKRQRQVEGAQYALDPEALAKAGDAHEARDSEVERTNMKKLKRQVKIQIKQADKKVRRDVKAMKKKMHQAFNAWKGKKRAE